jgi:hypothetical protein
VPGCHGTDSEERAFVMPYRDTADDGWMDGWNVRCQHGLMVWLGWWLGGFVSAVCCSDALGKRGQGAGVIAAMASCPAG